MDWTWFAIVVTLGLAALVMFWRPLVAMLGRVRAIGGGRVLIDPANQVAPPPPDPQAEAEAIMRLLDDPVLVETETALRQELRQRNLLGPESIQVLIRLVARQQVNLQFNDIYHRIFGSQLRALHHLNTNPGPQERLAIEFFHTQAAMASPQFYRHFSFETWLSFLRTQGLIVSHPNERIELSVRGRSFLTYLVQNGASLDRVF